MGVYRSTSTSTSMQIGSDSLVSLLLCYPTLSITLHQLSDVANRPCHPHSRNAVHGI